MSERQIAWALNISRPVVAKYWQGFISSGLSIEQLEELPDSVLIKAVEFVPREPEKRYLDLMRRFPGFVVELRRPGVTLQLLWEEYKIEHADGFQYSQFCHHFQVWRDSSDVRMHITHKAGDKMFVDYAGDKLSYTKASTGKKVVVETFVAVLGASGLTYAEASVRQEKEVTDRQSPPNVVGSIVSAWTHEQ